MKHHIIIIYRKGSTPDSSPSTEEAIVQPQVIASDDDYYDGKVFITLYKIFLFLSPLVLSNFKLVLRGVDKT